MANPKGSKAHRQRTCTSLRRLRQRPLITLAAVTCGVGMAACGSSSKSTSPDASSASPQAVKYSDCMRSHGVPNFPDLNANGSVNLPSDINPDAPAFQSAQQACAGQRPGAGSPPPPISLAQQKSFVANAKCMRRHGVPNFPDPVFGPGGEGGPVAADALPRQAAQRDCRRVRPRARLLPLGRRDRTLTLLHDHPSGRPGRRAATRPARANLL